LQWLEVLLDEAFVIPGTGIRFGIDGIIGLVPGLGDVLAGILSLLIPLAAWVRGVPYVTLVRMLTNVSIGLLVGSIPFVGDGFLIFWKANRRNYRLLTRSIAEPHRHTWKDWIFLLLLGLAIAAVFSIPIVLLVWMVVKLAAWQPA
jgi:NAD/NADP transhydrogenase beta subunit